MNKENDSYSQGKEQIFLFTKDPSSMIRVADTELKRNDFQINTTKDDMLSNEIQILDENRDIPDNANIEITLWGNRKLRITKALIPLRIALLFWFASGSLFSPFYSLLLTHRGLTLNEFSSVFSVLFLIQLAVSYICGIIADKLGNSKPILLFLMLSTILVVVCLLLAPQVRDKSCLQDNINVSCFKTLNYTTYLEYCGHACFIKIPNSLGFDTDTDYNNKTFASAKVINIRNLSGIFKNEFSSNETQDFCNDICSCLDNYEKKCSFSSNVELKILYAILTASFFSLWSNTCSFLDFASLNLAKQYNSDLGKERFFGFFGALLSTFLCNFVLKIDRSGTRGHYDNVFWFGVALNTVSALSASKTSVVALPPGINLTKKTLQLLTNIEIVSVICVAFVAGTAFTFNNFFKLWFLDSLKASTTMIGLYIITFPLYSLPMYLTSEWWLKKLGSKKIFIISLLGYSVNGLCFSFLYYPWFSLIIEVTGPFSFHLFWFTLTVHCRKIAPEGFAATLHAVVAAIHLGIGRSFSVSIGGYLISIYGARATFRMLAGFCFITAILYLTFLYLRISFRKKDIGKRSADPEEVKSMRENEA